MWKTFRGWVKDCGRVLRECRSIALLSNGGVVEVRAFYVGLSALGLHGACNPGLRPGLGCGRAFGAQQGQMLRGGKCYAVAFARNSVGAGWGFAGFYFFEEPDDAYADEEDDGEPAEDVDEGPFEGLTA